MTEFSDLERARSLARASMEICDRIGQPLAATYLSMAIDQLVDPRREALRAAEPIRPWGEPLD